MKSHQVDCPKCKEKKSITWTQKMTDKGIEIFVGKCTECEEISDVVNKPLLKNYNEQTEYYLK